MRIPRNTNLEPQVIVSIKRYRRRALTLRLVTALPPVSAVIAAMSVYLIVVAGDKNHPEIQARSWVALAAIGGLFTLFVLFTGSEKIPLAPISGDLSLNVFRNALEGVSVGAGIEPPELLVLDLPTVNTITMMHKGKPAVGVTAEALEAALPRGCAEAMMAHEIAHILLGDVFIGSNKHRWLLVGLSLVAALVLPFVFLNMAFGSGAWIYLGLLGWTALLILMMSIIGRLVNRQNDLLADSLAAKMTSDPAAVKDAILLLDDMFLKNEKPFKPGSRFPALFFVYEVRPEVELAAMREMLAEEDDTEEWCEARDSNILKGLRKDSTFPRTSTEERIKNLEAIERGHWQAFENRGSRHKYRWLRVSGTGTARRRSNPP